MALRCKRRCEIYVLLGAGSLTTVFLGVGPIPEEAWKWAVLSINSYPYGSF